MFRRRATPNVLLALACLATAGCSSDGSDDWRGLYDLARATIENSSGAVGLKEAASIPFATLGVRVGDDSEHIIILATDENGERLWTSAERRSIQTRHGRIVATAGFDQNLSGHTGGANFDLPLKSPHLFSWSVDFADMGRYSIPIDCQDAPSGPEAIDVLGKTIETVRVEERCTSAQLNWQFTNIYWVSSSSDRVWRSMQYVHPNMAPLQTEILRPPATPD